jgi:iron complex outermembrane receptor protein
MTPQIHPTLRQPFSVRSGNVDALCTALTLSALLGLIPASAQVKTADATAPAEKTVVLETFVVNSVRASLLSAQETKANAPQFVDSIVAQDVGKLPDNTVADALQRIAGIQVARSFGEANNPVIRGLPNIETTLNGYEVYTGTGRGVAFQDIPAEMVAGLDAYKSINPDQIEGGVAGLIDVRLRRPLDFKEGLSTALNVRGMHSSQARKNSYFVSGLVNNHWKTANGEFGLLLDVSYQQRHYEDQIFYNWVHYPFNFDVAVDASGKKGYYADNFGFQVIPGDRTRPAAELALQWKTKSGLELYSETLFTGYRNTHSVDFFIGIPSWGGSRSNVVLYPAGYLGVNIPDPQALNGPGTNALFVKSLTATATNTIISKQAFSDYTNTIQGAFGGKWVQNNLILNAEASYNISMVKTRGVILDTIANTPTEVWNITYNDGSNPTTQGSGLDFTNPSNFVASNLFDQWSRAYSGQYALKTDALISLNNAFIKSLKLGLRYSDREVNFHQANPGSAWGPWVPATSITGLGVVTTNHLFVPASDMNIRTWWSPDANFLLTNTDVVRTAGGRPLGPKPVDPASTFTDQEKTLGIYAMANYNTTLGSTPLDGVFGVRIADTHQNLGGYQHPLDSTGTSIPNLWVKSMNQNASWQVLPTLNGRLHFTDQLQMRFSATKTLTRPNFADLNPALALFHSGPTSQVGSGNGGNPNLSPIKSTNYDLSLEYYFAKTSQVSVTFFDRELQGYVQSFAKLEDVSGTPYLITRPQNTGNGRLKGFEFSYQQFLDTLSIDALKGLGFQFNYTGINGTTEDPANPGQQQQITQVAKSNYNVILIYEKGPFSSRLAYTWRGTYIDAYNYPGFQGNTVYVQPTKQMDFSASYNLTKEITITFDATNILGSKYRDRMGPTPLFNRDVRNYDTTYAVGARFRF